MGNEKRLTVPGRYDQISAICDFVADGAEKAGLDEAGIFGVQLACDEACTNIIEHAYGEEDAGDINVSWYIRNQTLTVVIKDHGRPFNPDDVPSPIVPTNLNQIKQLKVGGLGVHFIRKMMDEVSFSFNKEEGNTLILKKRLKGER